MASKRIPTLAEILIDECTDPAEKERIRQAANEHYGVQFGARLVAAGIQTPAQVSRGLAKQAKLRGDHRRALDHIDDIGAAAHAMVMNWAHAHGAKS
jgi:hypothetical protein